MSLVPQNHSQGILSVFPFCFPIYDYYHCAAFIIVCKPSHIYTHIPMYKTFVHFIYTNIYIYAYIDDA